MKHLLMVCNLENVQFEKLTTSSSRYELSFANDMSSFVDKVSVISPKINSIIQDGKIKIYPTFTGNLMFDVKPIIKVLKKLIDENEDIVILFWGYNPILINSLRKLKAKNVKVMSMIYDTHLGELENKKLIKKIFIHLFYSLGRIKINSLDGVLLFKEKAKVSLKVKIKSCVILPAINLNTIVPFEKVNNKKLTFLYSGTLCAYNGILELLNAFQLLKNENVVLKIFGDGPLLIDVQNATKKDHRIQFGGRISNRELQKELEHADIMLNLRKVPSVVNDFAYPSKVIEYMSYGKVVMSTNVSEHDEFCDAVFELENLNESTILKTLTYICENKELFKLKVENSVEYLKKYHDSNLVSLKTYKFLFPEV